MEAKIEWKEPTVVREKRKKEAQSLIKKIWLVVPVVVVTVSALVFPVAFYYGPQIFEDDFVRWIRGAIVGIVLIPSFLCLACVMLLSLDAYSKRTTHEINWKGVFRSPNPYGLSISWKRVGIYRFSSHSEISNIRVFEFQTRRMKWESKEEMWFQFPFDPNEVDESEIRAVVETYFVDEAKRQDST